MGGEGEEGGGGSVTTLQVSPVAATASHNATYSANNNSNNVAPHSPPSLFSTFPLSLTTPSPSTTLGIGDRQNSKLLNSGSCSSFSSTTELVTRLVVPL